MKENKAFRIPFTTKKQLKSRQALHRISLKPQYKVYRGASPHKKLTDINRCLIDPANRCLTDV